jgi:hypothetical protein
MDQSAGLRSRRLQVRILPGSPRSAMRLLIAAARANPVWCQWPARSAVDREGAVRIRGLGPVFCCRDLCCGGFLFRRNRTSIAAGKRISLFSSEIRQPYGKHGEAIVLFPINGARSKRCPMPCGNRASTRPYYPPRIFLLKHRRKVFVWIFR